MEQILDDYVWFNTIAENFIQEKKRKTFNQELREFKYDLLQQYYTEFEIKTLWMYCRMFWDFGEYMRLLNKEQLINRYITVKNDYEKNYNTFGIGLNRYGNNDLYIIFDYIDGAKDLFERFINLVCKDIL